MQVTGHVLGRTVTDDVAPDLAEAGGAHLTAAAVVALVADWHSRGALIGEIVDKLGAGRLLGEDTESIDFTLAAISFFRGCRLPGPRWWDADLVHTGLLEAWARAADRRVGRGATDALLRDRWNVPAELSDDLHAASDEPPSLAALLDDRGARSPAVAELCDCAPALYARDEAIAALDLDAAGNQAIIDTIATVALLTFTQEAIATEADEPGSPTSPDLDAFAQTLDLHLRRLSFSLTVVELAYLQSSSVDEQLLREHVAVLPRRIRLTTLSSGHIVMQNGISDRVDELTLAADWQVDAVYSRGARSGVDASGPTPYLWLVLEPHDELAADGPPGIALGLLPDSAHPVELTVGLGPDPDAPFMGYGLGTGASTREFLALLLLTGNLIVDVFRMAEDDRLALIHRFFAAPEDLIEHIRDDVHILLRASGPAPLVAEDLADDDIVGSFMSSETAKSELLLLLTDPALARSPSDALAEARAAYLDAQVGRALALHAGGDTTDAEERVLTALRGIDDARARAQKERPLIKSGRADRDATLAATTAGLATPERALVHFNLREGRIDATWTTDGGRERGWISGEQVDVGALARAVRPFTEGARADVEPVLEAAAPLAGALLDAFGPLGVRELVILPWGLLQAVPFGALPVADGVLDDHFGISYAPSAAILRLGHDAPASDRHGISAVSAHGGTLPWGDPEVQTVAALHGSTALVGTSRASVVGALETARVAHLVSHGRWYRDDHFASVIDLCLPGVFDRYLSAAELHRDVNLIGVELAVLAACDTGRSPSIRRTVEGYTGIDAPFLVSGVRAVVSALWPVNDFAALLFAAAFHADLSRGHSVGEAFRAAVRAVRDGGRALLVDTTASAALDAQAPGWQTARERLESSLRHPNRWAPFKLSGAHWAANPLLAP